MARPSEMLDNVLQGGIYPRLLSAGGAVAFVREAFREPHVRPDQAVLVALGLVSCRQFGRHARVVFAALLESPLLDARAAAVLCRRVLYARDPARGLLPPPRPLRGAPLPGDAVFDLPGGRYAIARRDLALSSLRVDDAFRRYAVPALARLGESPAALVRRALRAKVSVMEGRGHALGALDLVAERHGDMPEPLVREALERFRRAGLGAVKLRAYEVGEAIFGPDFARPALDDGDRKVRAWARRTLGVSPGR